MSLLSFSRLLACTVCFGDPSSKANQAVFAGVLFLIGIISGVLISIVVAGFRMRKNAQKQNSNP